jgi:hypothetical protein
VRVIVQEVARFLRAGISADALRTVWRQHEQLAALGFDVLTAVKVAEALRREDAIGPRQGAVLQQLATVAVRHVEIHELTTEGARLRTETACLRAEHRRLTEAVAGTTTRLEKLHQEETKAQEHLAAVEAEWMAKGDELGALRAWRAFLLRKTVETEAFFRDMERLLHCRRQGRAPDTYAVIYTEEIRQQVLALFYQLFTEAEQR